MAPDPFDIRQFLLTEVAVFLGKNPNDEQQLDINEKANKLLGFLEDQGVPCDNANKDAWHVAEYTASCWLACYKELNDNQLEQQYQYHKLLLMKILDKMGSLLNANNNNAQTNLFRPRAAYTLESNYQDPEEKELQEFLDGAYFALLYASIPPYRAQSNKNLKPLDALLDEVYKLRSLLEEGLLKRYYQQVAPYLIKLRSVFCQLLDAPDLQTGDLALRVDNNSLLKSMCGSMNQVELHCEEAILICANIHAALPAPSLLPPAP